MRRGRPPPSVRRRSRRTQPLAARRASRRRPCRSSQPTARPKLAAEHEPRLVEQAKRLQLVRSRRADPFGRQQRRLLRGDRCWVVDLHLQVALGDRLPAAGDGRCLPLAAVSLRTRARPAARGVRRGQPVGPLGAVGGLATGLGDLLRRPSRGGVVWPGRGDCRGAEHPLVCIGGDDRWGVDRGGRHVSDERRPGIGADWCSPGTVVSRHRRVRCGSSWAG
jgi:hypothetical protein